MIAATFPAIFDNGGLLQLLWRKFGPVFHVKLLPHVWHEIGSRLVIVLFFGFVCNVPAYFLYSLQRTYVWLDLSFWIKYYVWKKEEITSKQIYAWIFVTLLACIIGIIVKIINSLPDFFSCLWCPTSGHVVLRLRVIYFTSKKSMWKWINNFQIEKGKVFLRSITWSEIENEKV